MSKISEAGVKDHLVQDVLPKLQGSYKRLVAGEKLHVMDLGCGAGKAVITMATAFPRSEFYGLDFSEDAIQYATNLAKEAKMKNVHFALAEDAAQLDERHWAEDGTRRYDIICALDVIHVQAHPAKVLSNIRKCLQPDGHFLMLDIRASSNLEDNISHPMGSFFYSLSTLHCMTVSVAQKDDTGLSKKWGEQLACSMLQDAGFDEVDVSVAFDKLNNIYVCGTDTGAKQDSSSDMKVEEHQ